MHWWDVTSTLAVSTYGEPDYVNLAGILPTLIHGFCAGW